MLTCHPRKSHVCPLKFNLVRLFLRARKCACFFLVSSPICRFTKAPRAILNEEDKRSETNSKLAFGIFFFMHARNVQIRTFSGLLSLWEHMPLEISQMVLEVWFLLSILSRLLFCFCTWNISQNTYGLVKTGVFIQKLDDRIGESRHYVILEVIDQFNSVRL